MIVHGRNQGMRRSRPWDQRKTKADLSEPAQPAQPQFTPFQCIQIYWLNCQGVTQAEIARKLDCSQMTISRAVKRGRESFSARLDIPRLRAVGWDRQCGHKTPINVGDEIVCCRCFVSGYDETAAMQVTPADLLRIEREEFEAGLPRDKDGNLIMPQEPLKPFAQRKHPKGARAK